MMLTALECARTTGKGTLSGQGLLRCRGAFDGNATTKERTDNRG